MKAVHIESSIQSHQETFMKRKAAVLLLSIVAVACTAFAADKTTLVAALKAAGLVDTLKGAGPFTVFAPTNEAFAKLPAGTVETLLKPENKDMLVKILTYHVVAGRLSAAELKKEIRAGHGQATLKTVSGGTLIAMMQGSNIVLKDEKGDMSTVTIPNVFQSNGVIHVVD